MTCEGSRSGYRDMEEFIAGVDDPRRSRSARHRDRGSGCVPAVPLGALHRWPELAGEWHRFSDDRRIGRAREWLADAGYRPADVAR